MMRKSLSSTGKEDFVPFTPPPGSRLGNTEIVISTPELEQQRRYLVHAQLSLAENEASLTHLTGINAELARDLDNLPDVPPTGGLTTPKSSALVARDLEMLEVGEVVMSGGGLLRKRREDELSPSLSVDRAGSSPSIEGGEYDYHVPMNSQNRTVRGSSSQNSSENEDLYQQAPQSTF